MPAGSVADEQEHTATRPGGWRERLWYYRWPLTVLLLCQLGQVGASLLLPALSANVIDDGVLTGQPAAILRYGGLMLLAAAVQLVLSVTAVVLGARIAFRTGLDMRAGVFSKVHHLSLTQVQNLSVGSLITRCTNDVLQVQTMLTMTLTMIVIAPIMGVGGVMMAIRQDVQLSSLLLVIIPILAAIIGGLTLKATPVFQRMQHQLDQVNATLREQISGIRVIRAFLQQRREASRFGRANTALTDTSITAGRLMVMMMPSAMLVMNLASVALIWSGAVRIPSGELPVGTLIAFMSYVSLILISVMMLGMLIVMLPRALVSARRIDALLSMPDAVAPPRQARPLPAAAQGLPLRFEHVCFGYPGAEAMVLKDISFTVEPGEVLGIIGPTGSGKSTIVNLMARLDDPNSGCVALGGVDLRDLAPQTLSASLSYVPQQSYLLSGTVASTLKLGNPEATDDALWHVLEIAQAADFVRALPDGLQALVEQGGSNFSGGQRQRLAIARALLHRAAVYLFDDSFSALDQSTAARLRQALKKETAAAVTVIVDQRISSMQAADRILVLDHGAVAAIGTHDSLLRDCPVYADISRSQQHSAAGGGQ